MILHIILDEKFTDGFISFINNHFDDTEHKFLILTSQEQMYYCKTCKNHVNVMILHKKLKDMKELLIHSYYADKIILHSLLIRYIPILIGCKIFAKKTYVALWGGEIYSYRKDKKIRNAIKRRILSRVKGITCELEEDYELTKKYYNTNAQYFPCMMYLSNVVENDEYDVYQNRIAKEKPFVMIGNSADPQNNHFEIIDSLVSQGIKANYVIPLSYGDKNYGKDVAEYAINHLSGNVKILQEFLPLSEYLNILKTVDIVVYAHRRQQALGNTFHMLAYGSKVYLNSQTTTYNWMIRNGFKVFPSDNIDENFLTLPSLNEMKNNLELITIFSSIEALEKDWKAIFDD